MNYDPSEILKLINEITPYLLEIGRQQVFVEVIRFSCLFIIAVFFFVMPLSLLYRYREEIDMNEHFSLVIVAIITSVLALLVLLNTGGEIIGRIENPDYYAIREILKLML